MTVHLYSDNHAGASKEVLDAMRDAARGQAPAYGGDAVTASAIERIRTLFEAPNAEVLFCGTGTAANSLSLAALTPPWGAIYCHPGAHVNVDECGAPEFQTGGAKLVPLPDRDGRLTPDDVRALTLPGPHGVHSIPPSSLSLTQCTERGLVYTLEQTRGICDAAKANGLKVHMDGARFSNACAALGATPAEMTWKAGVDVLSFGLTKNGAIAAEAIVAFDPQAAETLARRRMRAGHLFSKMRFFAVQFDAMLSGDLWLRNARHANAQARRLADGLAQLPGCRIVDPCEANEVFVAMAEPRLRALREAGFGFGDWWTGETETCVRLVCAFNTPDSDVDAFLDAVKGLA